jgi:hopanoid-associated phosphorylase
MTDGRLIAVTGMRREVRLLPKGHGETVVSGGGNAGLAAKIEQAIARGGKAVISVGICGGLAPGLRVGATVLGTEVVGSGERYGADPAWLEALARRIPKAVQGVIAGVDAVACEPSQKAALCRDTGAAAVDMESHIAARVAAGYGLPFAALRVVSDAADDRLPPAVLGAVDTEGHLRLGAVLASVARNPLQVPALIRAGRGSERAMQSLLRCLDLVGVGLGCPHLG